MNREKQKRGQIGLLGIILVTTGLAVSFGYFNYGGRYSDVGLFCFSGTLLALISHLRGHPSYVVELAFFLGGSLTVLLLPFVLGYL